MATDADLLIHRLLMIDDNPRIHEDYRKILAGRDAAKVSSAEAALFGEQADHEGPSFDIDSAMHSVSSGVRFVGAPFAQATAFGAFPGGACGCGRHGLYVAAMSPLHSLPKRPW